MTVIYQKHIVEGEFTVFDEKPPEAICVNQTHSNIVLTYSGNRMDSLEADGIIVDFKKYPKILPTIKTADCLPVCFIGQENFALVHAGWRGLATNILIHPALVAIHPHRAIIGPSIQCRQFEVTKEFYQNFPNSNNFIQIDGKIFFNLQAEAQQQIVEKYQNIDIIDCNECTLLNEKLFSFRRDKTEKRNWNTFIFKEVFNE